MRKTVTAVFAFIILFAFAVSGAMAQTWKWMPAYEITPETLDAVYTNIRVTDNVLEGSTDNVTFEPIALDNPVDSPVQFVEDPIIFEDPLFSAVGPNGTEYVIDANSVGFYLPDATDPTPFEQVDQPILPTVEGSFVAIAVGSDGRLYVLFETNSEPTTQYILVGNPPVTIKFTPRSLNLGSKGRWVTCTISDLPDTYKASDIDLDSICIVAINDVELDETTRICRDPEGPSNQGRKVMVKFLRSDLITLISNNPGSNSKSTTITIEGSSLDESFQFYGEDTIKTKPAKVKKPKKVK